MEYSDLSSKLMLELSKIYHSELSSKVEVYYQGEMKVLTFLANCKNDTVLPSDVSKSLNMTSPRVSSILNNLERKGLIERDFSTIDRRKVYISITGKGKQRVSDNVSDTYNLFYNILKKIGENDAKELIRILKRLNETLENV